MPWLLAILGMCFASGVAANADDAKASALAKQNGCLGCHAVNKKIVGPGYIEVAKKYANDPNATAYLKNKILKGGAGSWGVVPMPAFKGLSDIELTYLATWILRGAPDSR